MKKAAAQGNVAALESIPKIEAKIALLRVIPSESPSPVTSKHYSFVFFEKMGPKRAPKAKAGSGGLDLD